MIGRFSNLGVYRELLQSRDFYKLILGGILALGSYFFYQGNQVSTTIGIILALISVAINGLPIISNAVSGIINRKVNVDELVSIAIIASLLIGEFLAAAVVSFVMVLGALIEEVTADSARKTIESLIKITSNTANMIVGDQVETVPIEKVNVGDLVLVKPGERIPVDAVIKRGTTNVDESTMTGEPIPKEKKPGDSLYAGTVNLNGYLEIETTKVGKDSTLGRVINLISEAEAHKPMNVALIDRYALWFTPVILFFSGTTWVLTGDVTRAITVLIVGCPCALILAAPTAIVATIGRAARSGILVKGGLFLEKIAQTKVVFFDKTGTLTRGKPSVDEIIPINGVGKKKILMYAASVEQYSTHPLAKAVLNAAHDADLQIPVAEEMFTEIGLGVRAQVNGQLIEVGSSYLGEDTSKITPDLRRHLERLKSTGVTPLVVYQDSVPIGIISVKDEVRPSGKKTIEKMRSLGINYMAILSGDHDKSAQLVAKSVGIENVWSRMNPENKYRLVKTFQDENLRVMFVGDGINDALALASANVSIAMGENGTDAALETADIVLMNDDITKIPFLMSLSHKMLFIIKLNIMFGLTFNLIAVLVSGAGFLTPVMGAIVHNIGSILVVLSSASISFIPDTD